MPLNLKPAVSTLARQTIKAAFEDLDRTITPVDSREFPATTLQHVQQAALDLENQLASRQSLRNMRRLMPLFRGLEHYAKVVDVLCNGTPFLPWIWAPITLILRAASEYVEAFEQIIKGYSRIAESLVRFNLLSNAFISNPSFQQTLAIYYADILLFHKHAYTFVRRSSWRLMFLTSWGRFQRRFENIMEDLDRHGKLIDQEASALDIAESRRQWQDTQAWREESRQNLRRQEDEQAAKQYRYIAAWLKTDETEQLTISDLAFSEGSKHPGTCGWALKHPKISSWLRAGTDMPLCYMEGSPGLGKTVLSAQLLNFLKINNRVVIQHFMNPTYATSTAYEQVLRSLLLQLIQRDGDLAAHVYDEYVLTKRSATISTLEQLVKVLFTASSHEPRQTQYIWILLDGFDAGETGKQASLMSLLSQLVSKNSSAGGTTCKILISSRPSTILSKRFRKAQTVTLTSEKQNLTVAITAYAKQRLHVLRELFLQLHLGPEDLTEIESAIAKKADGMFLYARLVLDYLEKNIFYSGDEVKQAINDLPEELSQFYRQILARILVPLDVQSVQRVKTLFGWIAFAKRPLKRLELLSALTFSSANPSAIHLVPDFILTVCSALIEERSDATLAFIHNTVQEFLQSSASNLPLDEPESLLDHGVASLTCMLAGLRTFNDDGSDRTKALRVVTGLHGFHLYAADHWVELLLAATQSSCTASDRSQMYNLAISLAQEVQVRLDPSDLDDLGTVDSGDLDSRVTLLPHNAPLRNLVKVALSSRSIKSLEEHYFSPADSEGSSRHRDETRCQGPLKTTLAAYQHTVEFLLQQDYYPGVSLDDLNKFKSQFGSSAFTCRLSSCQHATIGFESRRLRDEHEMAHARRFPCSYPDCRYPAFVSVSALKNHVHKYHTSTPLRRPIRRRPNMTSNTRSTRAALQKGSDSRSATTELRARSENTTTSWPPTELALPSADQLLELRQWPGPGYITNPAKDDFAQWPIGWSDRVENPPFDWLPHEEAASPMSTDTNTIFGVREDLKERRSRDEKLHDVASWVRTSGTEHTSETWEDLIDAATR